MDLHQSKNGMLTSPQQCENVYYSYLFFANAIVNWTLICDTACGLYFLSCFTQPVQTPYWKHWWEKKVPFITSTISAFWASFCVRRLLHSKYWNETRTKTNFNVKWTIHLCNIWLQIMKGTCKKKERKKEEA